MIKPHIYIYVLKYRFFLHQQGTCKSVLKYTTCDMGYLELLLLLSQEIQGEQHLEKLC